MFQTLRLLFRLLALWLVTALPVQAQSLTDILQAELLPGWRTEQGAQMAAIRLTLAPGWKTYWRSPGDAGIPPDFNWQGSQNLQAVKLHWPAPEVFSFNGMRSIGYSREVILPVEVQPRNPGQPVYLNAELDLGVCRDICVPARLHLTSALAMGATPDPAIRRAISAQPVNARRIGLTATRCRLEPAARGMKLTVEMTMPALGNHEVVVIEAAEAGIWTSDARSQRRGGKLVAEADLQSLDGGPLSFDRSAVRITVLTEGRAAETRGCQAG